MQAARFVPLQRRSHDQAGAFEQVAELDQVGRDSEMAVIIGDLVAQRPDAMRGAFEAFQQLTVPTAQRVVRFTVARERASQTDAA